MVGSHDEGGRTVSIQTSNEGSLYRCFVGWQKSWLVSKLPRAHPFSKRKLLDPGGPKIMARNLVYRLYFELC